MYFSKVSPKSTFEKKKKQIKIASLQKPWEPVNSEQISQTEAHKVSALYVYIYIVIYIVITIYKGVMHGRSVTNINL